MSEPESAPHYAEWLARQLEGCARAVRQLPPQTPGVELGPVVATVAELEAHLRAVASRYPPPAPALPDCNRETP
jgi:hypothetical protein